MGAEQSSPIKFKRGCFRDQLQYHDDLDWRLRSFDFPLLHTTVSVQAGKESKCTFCMNGEQVAYPDLMFHPSLSHLRSFDRDDIQETRKILPLSNAVDFEVRLCCFQGRH